MFICSFCSRHRCNIAFAFLSLFHHCLQFGLLSSQCSRSWMVGHVNSSQQFEIIPRRQRLMELSTYSSLAAFSGAKCSAASFSFNCREASLRVEFRRSVSLFMQNDSIKRRGYRIALTLLRPFHAHRQFSSRQPYHMQKNHKHCVKIKLAL